MLIWYSSYKKKKGYKIVAEYSDEWRAENSLPTVMLEERILGDASLRRSVDAANQEGVIIFSSRFSSVSRRSRISTNTLRASS